MATTYANLETMRWRIEISEEKAYEGDLVDGPLGDPIPDEEDLQKVPMRGARAMINGAVLREMERIKGQNV